MTDRERKSMTRASLILLGAAAVRFVLTAPAPADPPLEGRPSIADSLSAAGDSAAKEKERRSRPLANGETIDPNTATEEELDRLPGVGASIARRIVEDRQANGHFATAEELARVPGVGSGSVERLEPLLSFDARAVSPRAVPFSRARPSGPGPRISRAPPSGLASPVSRAPPNRVATSPGGGPVDLNRATAAELEDLPGIGPALAKRIVEYRDQHGRFAVPEDLKKVSGIGDKTFARLAPMVSVGR